jgi:hypothetical protein
MQTEEIKRKKLYDYLSQASQKAYSDIYLIANDVLAKLEMRGGMLELDICRYTPFDWPETNNRKVFFF